MSSSSEPSEEFHVHRLRFCDWTPSAIKSVSCDPFSQRVAIGREDGEIEVRQCSVYCSSNFEILALLILILIMV
jgi:hypothetical protein